MASELDELKARIANLEGRTPKMRGLQAIGAGRHGTLNDATPPTESDQMLANDILGCEEGGDKKAKADVIARLSDERRQRVLELAGATRKERAALLHPTPMAAPVRQAGLTEHWGRAKTTNRYADGTQEVVDSSTGEVLAKRQRTAGQIFAGVFGRSTKPLPTQTVTKGVTGAPRTS